MIHAEPSRAKLFDIVVGQYSYPVYVVDRPIMDGDHRCHARITNDWTILIDRGYAARCASILSAISLALCIPAREHLRPRQNQKYAADFKEAVRKIQEEV